MSNIFLATIVALATTTSFATPGADTAATAALGRIRDLAGDWEGTYQWSGARTTAGTLKASWYLTGNGSAVVENLIMGGVPMMTSVYHLDGADLRMTHFCAAQNQPRLKAGHIDMEHGVVDFDFVDITNLAGPDAPHVNGLEIRFLTPDHVTLTFLFTGNGKTSREQIDLRRAGTTHS